MKPRLALATLLLLATSVAAADPTIAVEPKVARPGDAVLVTVTGTKRAPSGTADGKPLAFFRARDGYQALFAISLDETDERIAIDIAGTREGAVVAVTPTEFPEADVVVEEEYANPPAELRSGIDADNQAIVEALGKDVGAPRFARAFRRPAGKVTSRFGEWRTFNDGHRSQHLGYDIAAREGARVRTINSGIVTLVRDTFLAGKVVVVSHGAGIASAYFHLRDIAVQEGDLVQAGDSVGRAGKTGRATGPHLHVAVRVPGGFVDPPRFFKLRITPAPEVAARRASPRSR